MGGGLERRGEGLCTVARLLRADAGAESGAAQGCDAIWASAWQRQQVVMGNPRWTRCGVKICRRLGFDTAVRDFCFGDGKELWIFFSILDREHGERGQCGLGAEHEFGDALNMTECTGCRDLVAAALGSLNRQRQEKKISSWTEEKSLKVISCNQVG
ncbi:hypothetical protein M0R45_001993 [Rubus argutus]|uniref:Uncharacterized protein n=1 Tax=Rubus argutus TaxID=59490 RepID=A0AAW1VKE0_RUBAR